MAPSLPLDPLLSSNSLLYLSEKEMRIMGTAGIWKNLADEGAPYGLKFL